MKKITERLSKEHQDILGKLDAFERAIDESSLDGLREGIRFFEHGLTLHRQKEEEALFPMVARHIGNTTGPVSCMLAEHQTEKELVAMARTAFETGDVKAAREHGRALVRFLRSHIEKEETIFFPLAENLLRGAERDLVEQRFWEIGTCAPSDDPALAGSPQPRGHFHINPEKE